MQTHTPTAHLRLRPASADDAAVLSAIYSWNVAHGTGTFELDPVPPDEMASRHAKVAGAGLPWIVAEQAGAVVGYAYASPFRSRPAYRYHLEDSIYLAADAFGRGIGRLLLAELIARCEALGARQLLAVIGDSANVASIGLHRALGFVHAGVLPAAGWKFDRWVDVVLMQRPLGLGADAPAPPAGGPA